MMLGKQIYLRQLTRFSLNSYKRSLSKNSVLFNDTNDQSDAIGNFLSEINAIKKSAKSVNNDLADNQLQDKNVSSNTESKQIKEPFYTELQQHKELSHDKQIDLKELSNNDFKEPVFKNKTMNKKEGEWGDLYSELPANQIKKTKLVSSKVYNDSVLKNMFGKTILSSVEEKKSKKKSNKIKEEIHENSSVNSADYWMANSISYYNESSDIKTSKVSKKSTKDTNKEKETTTKKKATKVKKESPVDIFISEGELINNSTKDSKKEKESKSKIKVSKTKKKAVKDKKDPSVEIMNSDGEMINVDNAAGMFDDKVVTVETVTVGTAIKDKADSKNSDNTVDTVDVIAKPPIDNGAARPRKSILQIPFDRELRRTVPSVSKVLNISKSDEDRLVLERWEKKMILELGVEGFKVYKENMFRRGHAIHSLIERYLLHGEIMHIDRIEDEVTRNHVKSISHLLHMIKDVQALESAVIHPELNYCGIVDCIARLGDDSLCIIDWKTSEKAKPTVKSLYDNPLQVVAYLGAINADPNYHHLGRIKQGAVVVIYNTGYSAVIHRFTTEQLRFYWHQWISRFKIFRERSQDLNNSAMVAWTDRKK